MAYKGKIYKKQGDKTLKFYHVLVEANGHGKIYEMDKPNQSEVLDQVIIPFLKGKGFLFDGYLLEHKSITRIVIRKSLFTTRHLAQYENASIPEGLLIHYTPEDMVEDPTHTTDVTREMFTLGNKALDEEGYELKNKEKEDIEEVIIDKTKVFIVHGHDELATTSTESLIRRLGLEPIIIREQANGGRTIIEKIEANSNVGYGIVLYTPCDYGAKQGDDNLRARARQNVVFEHGYLIGKIGRENVAALVKQEDSAPLEKPNDISGVVYINMDENKRWHLDITKELIAAGYEVDMTKI